ncbi:MAG: HAD family hydrolase [Oscillospiraceae bacterium]|nr:HAD family hydrolase [Oscillospiraceae bacterium]MDD6086012.1 HAD family hydrolase [Oscillospiraceae bacterium]MDY3258612.1 HAD family hydrolase [Ruminococcus callidus]
MYKLAVFDLDGTILNTLDDLAGSVNYCMKKFNMPERTIDEVRRFVGNGIRKLIERAVPSGTPESLIKEVHEVFNQHYKLHCKDKTKPYDGIEELITSLNSKGIKSAVVSNKADFAVKILCEDFFSGLFIDAVGEKESEGVRKKPAPDSVNKVIENFKKNFNSEITKKDIVYIGDSDVDIQTAKNAEVDCISVDWGFRDDDFLIKNGASKIVSTPKELEKAILQ